ARHDRRLVHAADAAARRLLRDRREGVLRRRVERSRVARRLLAVGRAGPPRRRRSQIPGPANGDVPRLAAMSATIYLLSALALGSLQGGAQPPARDPKVDVRVTAAITGIVVADDQEARP